MLQSVRRIACINGLKHVEGIKDFLLHKAVQRTICNLLDDFGLKEVVVIAV